MDTLFYSLFLLSTRFFLLARSGDIVNKPSDTYMAYEDGLKNYHQLDLPGVVGPESIAFDCNGKGPYVGVSDGRILQWQGPKLGWAEFAVSTTNRKREICDGSTDPNMEPICGRPLGLKFNSATCDLYIADAYYGLLVVGPEGGVAKQLASSAEGVPFLFLNALDIDTTTGIVYFTDSSIHFQRREYLLAIIHADKTGRLLKYDPKSKRVTVLFKGLAFPNGVALSQDNSFILVAELTTMQIIKFSLEGLKIHGPEYFNQLLRFPDNIKKNDKGEFWVALNSGRGELQNLHDTSLQNGKQWLLMHDPVAVKFSSDGKVVKVLEGNGGQALDSVSEVEEYNGSLWIGSSTKPYVGCIQS